MADVNDILRKYGARIESEIENSPHVSQEYKEFKLEMQVENSGYEKWAKSLGNILSIKVAEKDRIKIEKEIQDAHISVNPSQVLTLSMVSFISIVFFTLAIALAIYLINGQIQLMLIFLGVITSLFAAYYTYTMPKRLANAWKLKASSQMVPAILYLVVYMKHTSNLERAIEFAAQHLEGPLALDFKKIFYDVEIGKFSTIKQSLDNYLEYWREYAPEFVESFHLIESSLFEPGEQRRVEILEKSLQVILDGVYEKMLKYSREIRSPLTNLYMLGIILPTLGLALLPLASTLLKGAVQWYHIVVVFDILIPFLVFYMSSEILLKRPGGYGDSSILELNPNYYTFKSNKPWTIGLIIAIPLIIIGLLPWIMQLPFFSVHDFGFQNLEIPFLSELKVFDFKNLDGSLKGPFSPIAALLSMLMILGISLGIAYVYKKKTSLMIIERENTRKLEIEFTNTLFQLGNRLGDGIPAEIAFAKVADSTRGQSTQSFFALVNQNIQELGMSLEGAIFDKRRGAMIYFNSSLISTAMRILTESVKKGLQVAARSLMSISEYVKNIEKINQRLRDLLAEIVSDMKSNMVFLAPLLAGIVAGLSTMITTILNKLEIIKSVGGEGATDAGLGIGISDLFDVNQMIPPYFIQIAIGIYLIEIIYILTKTLVTVDSGVDKLKEKNELSKNLKRGMILYILTASVATIALTILSTVALSQL
ncbi:MAG: hypothetical protein AABX11_06935 [Nanoarchaeota archaeon]